MGHEVLSVSPYKNLGYKNYDYIHEVTTFQEGSEEEKKIIHVCKLQGIKGWEKEKIIAEKLFRVKQTSNLGECEVYIINRAGLIYFHSNFLIKGFNSPTKINAYEGYYNLIEILKILTTNLSPDLTKIDELLIISHCTKIKYYIDRSMITQEGRYKIELDGARNITLV